MLYRANGNPNTPFPVSPTVLKLINACPAKCPIPFVLHSVPRDMSRSNAAARCLSCLTYWEVTKEGVVVNMRLGVDVPVDHPSKKLFPEEV